MKKLNQSFTARQRMGEIDYEFFHCKDASSMEIEYHNHDFYEIYFFLSGNVTYFIEGRSYRLKPWDILLIRNNELHRPVIEPGESYERMVLWVKPDFLVRHSTLNCCLTDCFTSKPAASYNLIRPGMDVLSNIKSLLMKYENSYLDGVFGGDVLKAAYIMEIMVYINGAYAEMFSSTKEIDIQYNEKVGNILDYINENLSNDLSLDMLSEKFYLSKYHLLREFKKYTGYTIHQYIYQKRLIAAKALLKQGVQVTEACIQCGFGDYSNFIRSFKRSFGISPKKFSRMYSGMGWR